MLLYPEKTGISEFPDAITTRGKKHLVHLQDAINKGYESYLLFLIQRRRYKYYENCK